MNIEQTPQTSNNPEEVEEEEAEYSPQVQHALDSEDDIETKISQLEAVKNDAREQLEEIATAREQIQKKREKFIKNNKLTPERKKDYEEAIQLIDRREQAQHKKINEVEEARRVLAVRSEKSE